MRINFFVIVFVAAITKEPGKLRQILLELRRNKIRKIIV